MPVRPSTVWRNRGAVLRFSPGILFAAIAAFFGLVMAVTVPPFQTPDELAHYYRAYAVADFRWIAKKSALSMGDESPRSLQRIAGELTGDIPFHPEHKISVQKIREYLSIPLDESVKIFVPFPTTALTSPIPYIPQAVGMAKEKLHLPPLVFLYLGRIFNLIAWIALVFAIRTTPLGKGFFFYWPCSPCLYLAFLRHP